MNLKQINRPMMISLWIIGHRVIEIPCGKPRPLLSIIYTIILLMSYWYVTLFFMDNVDLLNFVKTSIIGVQLYRAIIHVNLGLISYMVVLSWIHRKVSALLQDLDVYFGRLNAVIKVMKRLGMQENYWQYRQIQYIQYFILCVELLLIFVCNIYFISGITIRTKLSFFCTLSYPTGILYITETCFVISIRYIGMKFKQLNEKLSERLQTLSNIDGTNELFRSEDDLYDLIKTVRQIHLELVRLAQYVNRIFDVQLLISNSISVVVITAILFNTYNILMLKIFDNEMYLRITGLIHTLVFYCFKIFTIGHTCGATSAAAQKIGGIVFKFYNFERSREVRGEIEEFTTQLIQNPVSLSAYGFIKLDYPFIFGVAVSVTTYLIILIQMNNSMFGIQKGNTTMSIQ